MTTCYNKDFYDMHTGWTDDYERFAALLLVHFKFKSVIDLGCGNAYIVSLLEKCGREVVAMDGSEHAQGYADNVVVHTFDLTRPIVEFPFVSPMPMFDLVLCLEVAEHLPPEAADTIVKSISDVARNYVVFSAAEKGYGGTDHLNEQPKEYWREKFEARGFEQDINKTVFMMYGLSECEHTWWFAKNIMIFKRRLG
jgi:SAM-dependent methyltransferase